MGILIDQLFYSEKGISEEKYRCFFFDMGENIHFHYRDLRIELSVAEFKELIESIDRYKGDVFKEIANGYQDGVLPNTNEHHTVKTFWNKERLQHPIKYNPQRISIEENTDGFHIHLRNYKLLLDKASFILLAEGMAQSLFALKNRKESDPLELLKINDLYPKLIVKTITDEFEELKIAVQKKYYSKTRQVLNGLDYSLTSSDNSKQIFEKAHKRVITFLDENQPVIESNSSNTVTIPAFLPLTKFIAEVATAMNSGSLNQFKLKLLYLFKQAEQGTINAFSIEDIRVEQSTHNPSVDLFNHRQVNMRDEYNKLLELYTQYKIFMVKPSKERFNRNYIQFIADKFKQFVDNSLAPLPCVKKVYLFGSLQWEKAGNYQEPFVHYDWVKLASDFDLLIEIDEDFLDEIPQEWDKKFFYQPPSAYYYHLGDLGNSQSSPLSKEYPGVTFYQHLIEAYLFFPSKGDKQAKDKFIEDYKGQLLYAKKPLKEQLQQAYGLTIEGIVKFSPASHNYVYQIKTAEQQYVLKIYNRNTALQPGTVKHEIQLLAYLKKHNLETAYPISSLTGDNIIDIDGNESILFDYIDGEFTQKVTIVQAQQAADLLARLHKSSIGLKINPKEKLSQIAIYELWINNAVKYVKNGQMSVYSEQELFDLKQTLNQLSDFESYLHGDVSPKNFKYTGQSCYLIDFEQFSYGLRLFDLIDGMLEFSMQDNKCNKEIADAFYHAYIQEYPLSDSQLDLFNQSLKMIVMAKVTRLYRTHLAFNYSLNNAQIDGLKQSVTQLAH